MPPPIITLTTDFGEGSPYVAQMKAVALQINPDVRLVDVTHSIAPQSIPQGAVILADVTRHFPLHAIHVCVVDPGVGTDRKIVYAEVDGQRFIAPNNGLLSLIARSGPMTELRSIESPLMRPERVTATFHGRDIMVPAAAHLSLGADPESFGPRMEQLAELDWPQVDCQGESLHGSVVWVDAFGNLITNITRDMLPAGLPITNFRVTCSSAIDLPLLITYGQVAPGTCVALFGSSDRLEIAVTNGSAAERIGCGVGAPVHLSWSYGS